MAQSAEGKYRANRQREYELDVLGTLLDQIGSDGMIDVLSDEWAAIDMHRDAVAAAVVALAQKYDEQG